MKRAITIILAIAFIMGLSITALAAATYTFQGEDVYSGNINNGDGMGGTADDNAADLQPGEKLSFTMPSNLPAGDYKFELRTTGNRTDYNIYVGTTLVSTIKRAEGSGWGFDWMTTETANDLITLNPGDVLVLEAPDNGEYGWVDWIRITGDGIDVPQTGVESYILFAIVLLVLAAGGISAVTVLRRRSDKA